MEEKHTAYNFSISGSVSVNKPKNLETLIVLASLTGKTSGIITINENEDDEQ